MSKSPRRLQRPAWAAACLLAFGLLTASAASPDQYNVSWDFPSRDHHGSMPLGNGDIALNAWATKDGEVHVYISKTDAWDDNARLVKVGKVRVRLEPNPFAEGVPFRQTLSLRDATVNIEAGAGARRTRVQLWADANHPVIHLTAEGGTPFAATAAIEMWRTNRQEYTDLQVSDVMMNRKVPDKRQVQTLIEPDTLLTGQRNRIGWFHHNGKSVGPQMLAEVQGLTGFTQPDPLLYRTFGAVVTAPNGVRQDDLRLSSPRATQHRFNIFVLTQHPATPQQWQAAMDRTIRQVERQSFTARRAAHEQWWRGFWDRSYIRASANPTVKASFASIVPTNRHPVRLGMDQDGGNKYHGEIGRLSIWAKALTDTEIAALAQLDRSRPLTVALSPGGGGGVPKAHEGAVSLSSLGGEGRGEGAIFSTTNLTPLILTNSSAWNFAAGLTIEAWIKPDKLPGSGARLVDKITPGGSDGFLFDTYPGNSLRFICGQTTLSLKDAVPAGQWTHVAAVADPAAGGCRLYVNGKPVNADAGVAIRDEAAYVSQMYHLQRFITACAGRGAYPIKFNGSLFTVPPGPTENAPDYRRWGPGYWWQNTRLPYISLCTSGDFDLMKPLFRMYAEELLPLCKYRTKLYLGHEGAYYPECIMFWGAVFSETYGWTPFEQRKDKLQESGWHKWEWVGGLELSWMMLDYYEHTLDRAFLEKTALPFAREILTFFDQHYPTNAQGKLVMHPSQALETWWHCTNAMPELAGCMAVTDRFLALPGEVTSPQDRAFWQSFRAKLPPIPLREVKGRQALAPAEFFAHKSNIENPELYPVFPFRLFAFNRPNADWALAALEHRWDKGHSGWRQDDIFMAYLGLADQARQGLVSRARAYDRNERFPAFWGPNYDWTPDQDHGGVLMKTFQSMLLQTDGRQIFLLPAWPKHWDVEFKLHAPYQTMVEGACRSGKIQSLRVTPPSRRADVTVTGAL